MHAIIEFIATLGAAAIGGSIAALTIWIITHGQTEEALNLPD